MTVVKTKKTSKTKKQKIISTKIKKSKFVNSEFDISKHVLVPKHTKLSDKDKEKLFEKYNITIKELPKIMLTDPAIAHLEAKPGDVIKIERNSPTSGKSIYYRGVINE